jgi:thiamine kinase-like enzyme
MSDSVVKLRIDSKEYDANIKRAGDALTDYFRKVKEGGGTLMHLDEGVMEATKAMGSLGTQAKTSRARMKELANAFTELTHVYNSLTDEEKESPFGRELNKQLETLKQRTKDAKKELSDIDKELKDTEKDEEGTASGIQALTSALGINIKSLAGWGAALTAGKVALDLAKDALFASEATVDEWGRTVASSQSLYQGFLNAINNGDISGYLDRMDDIVKAARAAYDEMDKLGTMKTIQAPKVSAQQTENERMRMMIQTGRYIAPIDGRKNTVFNGQEMQNGDKLTAGQIRYLEQQLKNGMQQVVKLVENEVKQTGKAINAYYDSLAQQNGMSLREFKKGTSSWDEFSKKISGYEEYRKWNAQAQAEYARQGGRGYVDFDKTNPYAEYKKWGIFQVDKMGENSYNDLVRLIQQRDQQAAQAYSMQSQAYRTINRAEGFTVRSVLNPNGGNGGTTQQIEEVNQGVAELMEQLRELQKEQQQSTNPQQWDSYQKKIEEVTKRVKELKGELPNLELGGMPNIQGIDIAGDYLKDAKKRGAIPTRESIIAQGQAALKNFKGVDLTPEKNDKNFSQEMRKLTSGISQITGGLKAMGFKLPEEIDQAIGVINGVTSVIEGVNTVISVFGNTALTANTAALVANTTALYANTAIPSIFAGGGVVHAASGYMVPGNSFSGDNVPALLNSGEVVLNKAQAGVLAHELQGGGMKDIKLSAKLAGGDIILSIDRTLMVQGKGQMATFK